MKSTLPAPPKVTQADLSRLKAALSPEAALGIKQTVRLWAKVKEKGGRVVVATGSGPNLHEGVTCQVAELVARGLVDGVITSSAVVGHEMAGVLERVRRVAGAKVGLSPDVLPADGMVEVALLSAADLNELARQTSLDLDHYRRLMAAPGREIIKIAGNLAYPTGLWVERVARQLEPLAKAKGLPLEAVAGLGCHPLTMLGACAKRGLPCLVSVPQLVGGGQVGCALGDSISISQRSAKVAELLAGADLIIESAVAMTQELHDGPFELFTGHGLWARHEGLPTFSLRDKALVRIDLDPQIASAWRHERERHEVSRLIAEGKPKAIGLGLPWRMEMSGFARIPGSLPIQAQIGAAWPLLAAGAARALGVKLGFVCYKQDAEAGQKMRDYIVDEVTRLDVSAVVQALKEQAAWR